MFAVVKKTSSKYELIVHTKTHWYFKSPMLPIDVLYLFVALSSNVPSSISHRGHHGLMVVDV